MNHNQLVFVQNLLLYLDQNVGYLISFQQYLYQLNIYLYSYLLQYLLILNEVSPYHLMNLAIITYFFYKSYG